MTIRLPTISRSATTAPSRERDRVDECIGATWVGDIQYLETAQSRATNIHGADHSQCHTHPRIVERNVLTDASPGCRGIRHVIDAYSAFCIREKRGRPDDLDTHGPIWASRTVTSLFDRSPDRIRRESTGRAHGRRSMPGRRQFRRRSSSVMRKAGCADEVQYDGLGRVRQIERPRRSAIRRYDRKAIGSSPRFKVQPSGQSNLPEYGISIEAIFMKAVTDPTRRSRRPLDNWRHDRDRSGYIDLPINSPLIADRGRSVSQVPPPLPS